MKVRYVYVCHQYQHQKEKFVRDMGNLIETERFGAVSIPAVLNDLYGWEIFTVVY